MSFNTNKPNRFTVSSRAENQAARLEREPAQRLLGLMNAYHSLDSKYFPSEKLRTETRSRIRSEVIKETSSLPPHIQYGIESAFKSKRAWDSMKERIF